MWQYIIRRVLYSIPILLGVNIITFLLFFVVNTPDDMARVHLGEKRVSLEQIQQWKQQHGYDKPLLFNSTQVGLNKFTDTLFVKQSLKLFLFDFGFSDSGRDISSDIKQRMWPSLAIAVPTLLFGLILNISLALLMIFFRNTYIDYIGVFICIILMSISALFYIIGGQYFFAKILKWFPISGYSNTVNIFKFIALPVFVAVISMIGAEVRWYRSLFIEEMNKEYVNTARSKGLAEYQVLFVHILKNAMIPILTGVIIVLPSLFMGSLLLESFFGIPGLGSYTIDAISQQDFAIVKSMVFLGAVLYIIGLVLTDIAYTIVDPRIKMS